jgi:hypothetical protein
MLPTKVQFIWLRVSRGEDYNVKSKWMTDDETVKRKITLAIISLRN